MKKFALFIVLIFCFSGGFSQAVNGLVAYYPFTGSTGDSSGNHHDGAIIGGVTLTEDRFGNPNSAYHFDGATGVIYCPNDSQLLKSSSLSYSVWFRVQNRPSGWQQNVILANIGYYQQSGGFEAFKANPPGTYGSMFRNSTMDDQAINSSESITDNVWYNLTVVLRYDSLADSTTMINYLDSTPQDSGRFGGSINYTAITDLFIGANIDTPCCQRFFLGDIDDVKIYDRALLPSEVKPLSTRVNKITPLILQPQLFPNPSNGITEVSNLPISQNNINIDITTVTGQVVYSNILRSTTSGKIKINLPQLSPGMYIARIKSGTGIYENEMGERINIEYLFQLPI